MDRLGAFWDVLTGMNGSEWAAWIQAFGSIAAIFAALWLFYSDKLIERARRRGEAELAEKERGRKARGLAYMLTPALIALEEALQADVRKGETSLVAVPQGLRDAIGHFHLLGDAGDELFHLVGSINGDTALTERFIQSGARFGEPTVARAYRAQSEARREDLLKSCRRARDMVFEIAHGGPG